MVNVCRNYLIKRKVNPFHSSPKVRNMQEVETNGGEQNEKETSKYSFKQSSSSDS